MFQSTYLYKVRQPGILHGKRPTKFQSTYLYKVRPLPLTSSISDFCFNPRTYIRYDVAIMGPATSAGGFNPRTYIRYDCIQILTRFKSLFQSTYLYKVRPSHSRSKRRLLSFNPRTYIRYD